VGSVTSKQVSHGTCLRCHRPLRSPESIARGYGSSCYRLVDREEELALRSLVSLCITMSTQSNATSVPLNISRFKTDFVDQINNLDQLFGEETHV
jgi:hypothetical protein